MDKKWKRVKLVWAHHLHVYSKTSLNLPPMGPTLGGPLREVIGLMSSNIVTMDHFGPK